MAYSAINNTEIDADSEMSTTLFTKIRDNIDSMKDGTGIDNDAILERHIASGAIHQQQLDTSLDNADVAPNNVSAGETELDAFLLTEPDYTLGVTFGGAGDANSNVSVNVGNHAKVGNDGDYTTENRYIETIRINSASVTTYSIGINCDIRYVNASPPYDLGDGQIPLFSFLRMDANNNIIAVHNSVNPPWAHNGPTKTKHNIIIDGKKIYRSKQLNENGDIQVIDTEITQAVKNADMNLIPHPFILKPGEHVILLDPVETLYLEELRQTGERISALLFNDYLRLDNEEIIRNCPNGVTPCKFKWKNTARKAGEAKRDLIQAGDQ